MNSKERIYARLAGQPVDRIPNLNIVMLFAAQHVGIPYKKFCTDYRYLVEAQTRTAEDFGIDILSTMSDSYREVSDFGGKIRFPEDDLPICEAALLQSEEDLPLLKDFNPVSGGRMADRINAIRLFKEQNGERYPILGWIEGPWAEFTDLASLSEGMLMMFDAPEFVEEATNIITEKEIECAIAQIQAGADIIGIGDAAASLLSPESYRRWVFPLEKKRVDAIHQHGGKVKLHICGNITHLLPDLILTGADIVDIDYMVDYEKSIALAGEKCCICGNLNPTELILQNKPEAIIHETNRLQRLAGARGIISSGCEIPRLTPEENVKAIADALHN